MGIKEDLASEVKNIFLSRWTTRDGQVVPDAKDLKLSNEGVELDATVLYADLAESTALVESETAQFAGEVYKAYLHCASKIIRNYGGEITAFDGDRVMAVFIGGRKNTNAVRSALAINHAVVNIINPQIGATYQSKTYRVRHAVGIDSSKLMVARTGIRTYNDLVWVGRAANVAAKLCAVREGVIATWITESVYKSMLDETKYHGQINMWEERTWTPRKQKIYGSSYNWAAS